MQVAVILLGLLVVPGISGCGCIRFEPKHKVAMPPRDASPEQVVRAYFDAIAAQDKETGRALLVPEVANDGLEFDAPDSPWKNWISATDLQIEGPRKDWDCRPGETCVRIYTSFNLQVCETLTQGDGPWNEPFGLRKVNGRWLIAGHGQG